MRYLRELWDRLMRWLGGDDDDEFWEGGTGW
jgi:hypothetical protein